MKEKCEKGFKRVIGFITFISIIGIIAVSIFVISTAIQGIYNFII